MELVCGLGGVSSFVTTTILAVMPRSEATRQPYTFNHVQPAARGASPAKNVHNINTCYRRYLEIASMSVYIDSPDSAMKFNTNECAFT